MVASCEGDPVVFKLIFLKEFIFEVFGQIRRRNIRSDSHGLSIIYLLYACQMRVYFTYKLVLCEGTSSWRLHCIVNS